MDWINYLQNVNYIAVAVATVCSYILGFLWYHWPVFGEAWANALGLTKEDADNTDGLGGAFIISLIGGAFKTLCVAVLMSATATTGVVSGALFGVIIALGLIVTSVAYHNGFARVPYKLTLIDSAHDIAELALIGAVLGGLL